MSKCKSTCYSDPPFVRFWVTSATVLKVTFRFAMYLFFCNTKKIGDVTSLSRFGHVACVYKHFPCKNWSNLFIHVLLKPGGIKHLSKHLVLSWHRQGCCCLMPLMATKTICQKGESVFCHELGHCLASRGRQRLL